MRVGSKVRLALAAVVQLGPCTSGAVRPFMPGVEPSNVGKYLRRAVGLQLLTINRDVTPHEFKVAPDWQERMAAKGTYTRRANTPAARPRPCALHQAWGASA